MTGSVSEPPTNEIVTDLIAVLRGPDQRDLARPRPTGTRRPRGDRSRRVGEMTVSSLADLPASVAPVRGFRVSCGGGLLGIGTGPAPAMMRVVRLPNCSTLAVTTSPSFSGAWEPEPCRPA